MGTEWCWNHNPTTAATRRRNTSRGGRAGGRGRPSTELKELKRQFEEMAQKVLKKKIARADAAVAGQLLAQARMCIRDGLVAREQEDLIQQVEEMRQEIEQERAQRRKYGPYGSGAGA